MWPLEDNWLFINVHVCVYVSLCEFLDLYVHMCFYLKECDSECVCGSAAVWSED